MAGLRATASGGGEKRWLANSGVFPDTGFSRSYKISTLKVYLPPVIDGNQYNYNVYILYSN